MTLTKVIIRAMCHHVVVDGCLWAILILNNRARRRRGTADLSLRPYRKKKNNRISTMNLTSCPAVILHGILTFVLHTGGKTQPRKDSPRGKKSGGSKGSKTLYITRLKTSAVAVQGGVTGSF